MCACTYGHDPTGGTRVENKETLADLLKQFLQGITAWLRALVSEFAGNAFRQLGLFTAAMVCVMLALVYLSIGLLRLLATLWPAHDYAAYLTLALALFVAATLMLLGMRSRKGDNSDGD